MNWDSFIPIFMFVPFFVWIAVASCRTVTCPNCGWRIGFGSPPKKTKRQFFVTGGCSCRKCGCEIDRLGNKVPPGTRQPVPVGIFTALAVVTAINIALICYGFIQRDREPTVSPIPFDLTMRRD